MTTTTEKLMLPQRHVVIGNENEHYLDRVNLFQGKKFLINKVKDAIGGECFERIKRTSFGPIIEFLLQSKVTFSRNIFNHLLQRRLVTNGSREDDLWFTFRNQLMRFSLREYCLMTGLPVARVYSSRKTHAVNDPWMIRGDINLKDLILFLEKESANMNADQKLRLGVFILAESIVLAYCPTKQLNKSYLMRASSFENYCNLDWGRLGYDAVVNGIKKIDVKSFVPGKQINVEGFVMAVHLWALTSVEDLGNEFGTRADIHRRPIIMQWTDLKSPTANEVNNIAEKQQVLLYIHLYNCLKQLI